MKEFLSLTFVLGLAMLWGGVSAWRLYRGYQARSWPKAVAIIEASGVSRIPSLQASAWMPKVQYLYQVDGTWHRGDRIAFESQLKTNPSAAERTRAEFVVGHRIAVYYDPRAPARSVLQATIGISDVIFATLGATAAVCLVLLALDLSFK